MDRAQQEFLDELLATPGPAGHEAPVQRVFLDYVEPYADEVETDAYGNAVAVAHGAEDGPSIAFAGHADEIGFVVTSIDERGFLRLEAIGSPDPAVSTGRHVEVHAADGPVAGVVGAKPAHLRSEGEGVPGKVSSLRVDVGARDRTEAQDLVEPGDPVTVARQRSDLENGRLAAPAMDDRTGVWTAAEGFRRAVEAGVDATVYAVSTIHEEIGKGGARMVSDRLELDAVVAVDVTFATDSPDVEPADHCDIELGGGPAIGRGGPNHPAVVDALRSAASDADVAVQFEALGGRSATDADAFFEGAGGVPTVLVSVPNRYMHSPVEVVDLADLDATVELLAGFAKCAGDRVPFAVDV